MKEINWLNYWDKKNIWTESDLWKKHTEIFFQKTSNIFNYNKEHIVLDIGCGNGDFANKIFNKVKQVFCLDTSKEYIDICKNRFKNIKNITVLKLSNNYTDLSFIKNTKFSIIVANSVIQYYNSQEEVTNLVNSAQKIATENALFLISDIHVLSNKKKSYLKLIYNSMINGYFIALVKMGFKLIINNEYSKTNQHQPLLIVDIDKLVGDLSIFVKKVNVINKNITTNINRKHLLIQL